MRPSDFPLRPHRLTDDGIAAAAAGPIRRPLDPYGRRSDPTTLILAGDVVDNAAALRPPTEVLQFDEIRFGRD